MSFATVSLMEIVIKQYKYKMRAYSSVFTSLIVLQVIGLLFSSSMMGSGGGTNQGTTYSLTYYSTDSILIFTLIWAFTTSILITTTAYRNDDLSFVGTRTSSSFANILFLLTISSIGGVLVFLNQYVLYVLLHLRMDQPIILDHSPTIMETISGVAVTILYIYLISLLGYSLGAFGQLHKSFRIIIPAVIFGLIINSINFPIVQNITTFFTLESSLLLFIIKIIIASTALAVVSTVVLSKLEGK